MAADGKAPDPSFPLVLIASGEEPFARSLGGLLSGKGLGILRAKRRSETLQHARDWHPDAFLLDAHLPETGGVETCRALRSEAHVGAATPIVIAAVGPVTRNARIEALRAGAWDVIELPITGEELALRLTAFAAAKREADDARAEGLIDLETGLYNQRGLLAVAGEVMADARRRGRSLGVLACVVDPIPAAQAGGSPADEDALAEWTERFSRTLRLDLRRCDLLGRIGPRELVVIAPHTGRGRAVELARRILGLARAFTRANPGLAELRVRIGCHAFDRVPRERIDAIELLLAAANALLRAELEEVEICPAEPVV